MIFQMHTLYSILNIFQLISKTIVMTTKNTFLTILLFISCALSLKGFAQSIYWCDPSIWNTNEHNGSFYAGIGYITGWYNLSTINVTQAGTGNRYSMKNVNGDNRTLDDKLPLDFSYRQVFSLITGRIWLLSSTMIPRIFML